MLIRVHATANISDAGAHTNCRCSAQVDPELCMQSAAAQRRLDQPTFVVVAAAAVVTAIVVVVVVGRSAVNNVERKRMYKRYAIINNCKQRAAGGDLWRS